jgi:hypothetical protein
MKEALYQAQEDKAVLAPLWAEMARDQLDKLMAEGVPVQEAVGIIKLYIKQLVNPV